MTLQEIRDARKKLKHELARLIEDRVAAFHAATDVSVYAIEIDMVQMQTPADPRPTTVVGNVQVVLEAI